MLSQSNRGTNQVCSLRDLIFCTLNAIHYVAMAGYTGESLFLSFLENLTRNGLSFKELKGQSQARS